MVKYIITDPCYILPDEIWSKACQDIFDENPNNIEGFDRRIEQDLKIFADSQSVWVDETGAGDWVNSIYGDNIEHSEFCADAGMVCVCELTPSIQKKINDEGLGKYCYALFEAEPDIKIHFDRTIPSWTVIRIHQNGQEIITSQEGINYDD